MDGLKKNKKTVILQNGSHDGVFEVEWREERFGEHPPPQEDLSAGCNDLHFSKTVQKCELSFRVKP